MPTLRRFARGLRPAFCALLLAGAGLSGARGEAPAASGPKPPRPAHPAKKAAPKPAATPAPTPEPPPVDPGAALVRTAGRYDDILRDALPLLEHPSETATLRAALADGRRAAAEVDRLVANAAIFQIAERDRQALQNLAIAAHLHLALFETHALEFDRARDEITRVRALLDKNPEPELRTEWRALEEGGPGHGLVRRIQLLTLPEFEAALQGLWSRARPVPFDAGDFAASRAPSLELLRVPAADAGSLEDRLVAQGAATLREALRQGRRQIAIPLPAGLYHLRGDAASGLDRMFLVPEISEVDPVLIDRNRFSLTLVPKQETRGPRFFLNGLEVSDPSTMPFGVYRVKVDAVTYPAAPELVRFIAGEGLPEKTREAWTIYVSPGSSVALRFDKASLSERLFRR